MSSILRHFLIQSGEATEKFESLNFCFDIVEMLGRRGGRRGGRRRRREKKGEEDGEREKEEEKRVEEVYIERNREKCIYIDIDR